MIGLEIRFLSGRFHGNRWQNAHNEGAAEWPPSPWRLLRALVSASYELSAEVEARPLLEKLGVSPPSYQLPAIRTAHTRHYMPDVDDSKHKRTKVLDNFVVVDGGSFLHQPQPVRAWWPNIEFSVTEIDLLKRLTHRIAYLGRAESWAEVEVISHDSVIRFDCWPEKRGAGAATSLMALEDPAEFQAWTRSSTQLAAPRSVWDVLTFGADRVRREGWSKVPGTKLVRYAFSESIERADSVADKSERIVTRRPTVARYAIRSAVLPRVQDALLVGERMRQGLMSQSLKVSGNARPVFSGHFDDGRSRQHEHAFVLPSCDFNEAGRIDTITVAAKMGFDVEEVRALERTRRLYGRDSHFLDLVLIGIGDAADFGGTTQPYSAILHESVAWESVTPFIPTRHPKKVRGTEVDDIRSQVRRCCEQVGLPNPSEVEFVDNEWHKFRRLRRDGGGRRGPDRGYGVRIGFSSPVRGPIALGYGSHFGLGLFRAV